MDIADQYIDRVQHLPPSPTIVSELLGLFGDLNRNVDRIVELISYDPSLTAEVLKRSNSAFFRGAEPASDIFESVTRLGIFEVYSVVTAVVESRDAALAKQSKTLDVGEFWRHSIVTAVAASTLARRIIGNETLAFTTGLLHDIGKLILAAAESATYGMVLQQAGGSGKVLARAEEVALGISHPAVGARLLTRWGLPRSIILVVLHHHRNPAAAAPYERLTAVVQLANAFAHHLAGPQSAEAFPLEAGEEPVKFLQMIPDDVGGLLDQVRFELQHVQEILETKP